MEKKQFEEIIRRLDLIAKLISLSLAKGEKILKEKVKVLDASGFKPKEIATLLDKRPNHIHQILHKMRTTGTSKQEEGGQSEQGK